MDEHDRYEHGMVVRREVLGDAHVDRTLRNKNAFNETFQEFITRYAWGEVWSRPGLTRSSRSLITLGLLIALNREEEFRMHIRAALNNGVTANEIQELLLHAAIYCGLPAANNAFNWAQSMLSEEQAG